MKQIIYTPLIILLSLTSKNILTQTSLSPGDIAFIGFNLDSIDEYAFILLEDVDANTTIQFTDQGWNDGAPGNFVSNIGDTSWTWSSDSALSCGTVINISTNNPGFVSSYGSISGGSPNLSELGDQLFAFQGTIGSPLFIAGIHSNVLGADSDANWTGSTFNNQTSALPDVLTNGVNAIRLYDFVVESDNWQYNCAITSGTKTAIRNAINNLSNWINNDTSSYAPASPGCSWSFCQTTGYKDFSNSSFKIYPNPTNIDAVTLDLDKTYEQLDIAVTNSIGQLVLSKKLNFEKKVNLQIEGKPGIYFIKIVKNEDETIYFKVIKN